MPLNPDDFSRLPPEVQQEMLERDRKERRDAAMYQERIKSRRWSGALLAAVGAAIVAYLPSFIFTISEAYYLVVALIAGAAGWLTVHLRLSTLGGTMLVGGSCIVANFVGLVLGLCPPLLIIWPLYVGVGAFVGMWGHGRRQLEDSGF